MEHFGGPAPHFLSETALGAVGPRLARGWCGMEKWHWRKTVCRLKTLAALSCMLKPNKFLYLWRAVDFTWCITSCVFSLLVLITSEGCSASIKRTSGNHCAWNQRIYVRYSSSVSVWVCFFAISFILSLFFSFPGSIEALFSVRICFISRRTCQTLLCRLEQRLLSCVTHHSAPCVFVCVYCYLSFKYVDLMQINIWLLIHEINAIS